MTRRDPSVPVQRQASLRRGERSPAPRRGRTFPAISQIVVGLLFVALLVGTVAFIVAALIPERSPSPGSTDAASGQSPSAGLTADPAASAAATGSGAGSSASPEGSPAPSEGVTPSRSPTTAEILVPMVPVVGFWATDEGISRAQLAAALEGRGERFPSAIVPSDDRTAIAQALGIDISASVASGTPDQIREAVADGALGLMRATDLTPQVRALALDDRDLFGNTRVASNTAWPLSLSVSTDDPKVWVQAATWTLVAGGDVLLDRGVHEAVVLEGKGLTYPFDGGRATITGRTCCGTSPMGIESEVPVYETRGGAGAVRALLAGAELAVAHLEGPTPDDWVHHGSGTTFTGDPSLLAMIVGGGLDWVSLANDHIADAGRTGIQDTLRHLTQAGLDGTGAGVDLAQARAWSAVDAGGHSVALLSCSSVDSGLAGRSRAGARPCDDPLLATDIEQAAGMADGVIVLPHWGVEYQSRPGADQRQLAATWMGHGADLILGSHSHVIGPLEFIGGSPVLYSLGNLVQDEDWSEATMEGLLVEATFHGDQLIQVRLHPTLIHDRSQPNLLDTASGQVVLRAMRRISEALVAP